VFFTAKLKKKVKPDMCRVFELKNIIKKSVRFEKAVRILASVFEESWISQSIFDHSAFYSCDDLSEIRTLGLLFLNQLDNLKTIDLFSFVPRFMVMEISRL
jgi:hypothetical protein